MTKKAKKKKDALTPKQRAFCLEFLKDRNATQAAIRAGYSKSGARVRGSELLTNRNVKEYLNQHIAKAEKEAVVSVNRSLERLDKLASNSKNPASARVSADKTIIEYLERARANEPETTGNGKPNIAIHIHEKPARVIMDDATDADDAQTGS